MTYVVAIPSFNRSHQLKEKTLRTLLEGHVDPSVIYIFVADEQERDTYEQQLTGTPYRKIVIGLPGIHRQRSFIFNYFKEGTPVVSMDDDVTSVEKLVPQGARGGALEKIQDLDDFFRRAFELLSKEKLRLWGTYPVPNAFFMQDKTTTDLRFCVGVLHGFISTHPAPALTCEGKEDYEYTIVHFLRDGGVLRFNGVCAKQKSYAAGGLGSKRDRLRTNQACVEQLLKRYPAIVREKKAREDGTREIRLERIKRRANS